MKTQKIIKQYLFLLAGLVISAFGVAFSIKADLGTSPISSLPYVGSLILNITVGNATIIMHCALITLQILILRKKYEPVQLLQLPVAFIFGYITDFSIWATQSIEYSSYFGQCALCIIGIILVGIGVSAEVAANAVVLAGEGFILAVCKVTKIPFSKMKIIFDVSLVSISFVLSLLFLHKICGIREGTVAAAICVGLVTKLCAKPMQKAADKFING